MTKQNMPSVGHDSGSDKNELSKIEFRHEQTLIKYLRTVFLVMSLVVNKQGRSQHPNHGVNKRGGHTRLS